MSSHTSQNRLPGPRRFTHFLTSLLLLGWTPFASAAYDLDVNSTSSIKKISKSLVEDMLSFYNPDDPGQEVGMLPQPYYWWAAGAMFGSLVDYWFYTGDDSYVNLTIDGLQAQVGEHDDYMPIAQKLNEGNDDQGFWGLAAMAAAENNFPNPPEDKPQWLALAQAVFNTQAARWDNDDCDGGLRWQIYKWNLGYDYKNSISNGCFFAIGARLALFTGNNSYADWAEKTWDWMNQTRLIDSNGYVYDGSHFNDTNQCLYRTPYQFTYNAGVFINGASAMYNLTGEQKWKDRLDLLLDGVKVFFTGPEKNIMTEVACEPVNRCNLDQQSFKAYLSRWLATTTKWAPYTYDYIMPYLRASAEAAIGECNGGENGRMCGLHWVNGTWDGTTGVGQQMAALEVTLGCMIKERSAPTTAKTGGTSKGDPGAGGADIGRDTPPPITFPETTARDKAGGAFITAGLILGFLGFMAFLIVDETSDKTMLQQMGDARKGAMAAMTGGGAAAAVGAGVLAKKRDSQQNEKTQAGAVVSEQSSQISSDSPEMLQAPAAPAFRHVRSRSESHFPEKRLSNMPIGWPHNPSVRNSMLLDPSPQRPVSMMQPSLSRLSRADDLPNSESSDSAMSGGLGPDDGGPRKIKRKSVAGHRHTRSMME